MPDCTVQGELFGSIGRRRIEVGFDGGDVTSDAGLLLIRKADEQIDLLNRVASKLPDPRAPARIEHSVVDVLRQRVYGLVQGYEDLNDHDRLRHDLALPTALGKVTPAASSPTLCRFEQRADRALAGAIHEVILDRFIASFTAPPEELVLDFDATDDPVHGAQEGRFFHGYYDTYCFLPLYVFCGEQLLVSYLRPANIDAAKQAGAILKGLVQRLRARLAVRAHRLSWRLGLLPSPDSVLVRTPWRRLHRRPGAESAHRTHGGMVDGVGDEAYALTGEGIRCFGELWYRAGTWAQPRRVIVKAEITKTAKANPRFVVTNLTGDPRERYESDYCARGEMENRIKACQLGLFATEPVAIAGGPISSAC